MDKTRGLWHGKCVEGGKWIEGYFAGYYLNDLHELTPHILSLEDGDLYEVIPETLGECTSLRDKNGKLIFEGDILKRLNTKQTIIYTVDWCEECAMFVMPCVTREQLETDFTVFDGDAFEVIGNIHDNPDLLTPNKT